MFVEESVRDEGYFAAEAYEWVFGVGDDIVFGGLYQSIGSIVRFAGFALMADSVVIPLRVEALHAVIGGVDEVFADGALQFGDGRRGDVGE